MPSDTERLHTALGLLDDARGELLTVSRQADATGAFAANLYHRVTVEASKLYKELNPEAPVNWRDLLAAQRAADGG